MKQKNPDQVKSLVDSAKGSLETISNRREAAQTELIQVQTRLKMRGEDGLHEKLQAAIGEREMAASMHRSLLRRAVAAKKLYEIMSEERDQARKAYVAPLKEQVERLGRVVFDESFQIEIDHDLKIVSRTLHNITVPFDSLSGGTREQLALIFRVACSMIVSQEGGMPLVIDDALGYTDPERLRSMGAVLAKSAKECQIVVFTCVPERYGHIGRASVVTL